MSLHSGREELDARLLSGAAGLVVLAALTHVGLEHLTGGVELGEFLQGKLLPALLWAGAAPLVVRAGARWPVEAGGWAAGVSARLAGFGIWHVAVNVLIRLPDVATRGGRWLIADALEGSVRYAPAALLLFALLLAAGQVIGGGPRREADRPEEGGSALLTLPGPNRVRRVPEPEVRWLEADGDHVNVHADAGSYRIRSTLKDLQERLAPSGRFVRVHRSSLVNAERVREVQPLRYGDWVAILDDGTELRIPRTRRSALDRLRSADAE